MTGLYQSARSFPGLDDNRGLGQCRHRDITLREEVLLPAEMLLGIPNNWHLTDDQVPIGNPLLELAILRRIAFRDGRTQNSDRKTARGYGRCMRDRIGAARKTGYDREPVTNEEPRKLFGPLFPIVARLARADNSDTARGHKFPCTLEIQQLDRVIRISQSLRVITGAVNADPKMLDPGIANRAKRQARIFLDVSLRDEVGRNCALVLAKTRSDRFEPRTLSRPKRLVRAELTHR